MSAATARRQPTPVLVRTGLGAALIVAVALMLAVDSAWDAGYLYAAVLVSVSAIGLSEFGSLADRLGMGIRRTVLVVGGAGIFLLQWAGWVLETLDPWLVGMGAVCVLTMVLLGARVVRAEIEGAVESVGATVAGWIYIPLLLGFLTGVRMEWGVAGIITVLGVCKAGSSGAYFAGTFVGRRRLAPRVSPSKTVAGAVGAVLGAVLAAYLLSRSPWAVMRPSVAPLFGLLVAGAAMVGDLAASLLKREARLKDSGQLLPGLGGMLDMVDDVLFAAPVSFLFLRVYAAVAAGG
ncbi:MAG: phosphatidate cytidylyltransferase [Candidatus Brocadiaceae bacterium]